MAEYTTTNGSDSAPADQMDAISADNAHNHSPGELGKIGLLPSKHAHSYRLN